MTVIRLNNRPRRVDTVTIAAGTVAEETSALKTIIGGDIECVRLSDDAALLADEEGLLKNLPRNDLASLIARRQIVGTALIVGIESTEDGERFSDCPAHILRSLNA